MFSTVPLQLDTPPMGYIWLFLTSTPEAGSLYLQIPLDVIRPLCLELVKYLRFICYSILAVDGRIVRYWGDRDAESLKDDDDLEDQAIYYFQTDTPLTDAQLQGRADPGVVKRRSPLSTSRGTRDQDFRKDVVARDGLSAFEFLSPELVTAMHIIPFARGSEWLKIVIRNRPKFEGGKGVEQMDDIDDVRNGITGSLYIHAEYDNHDCGMIKTPNHILSCGDIPARTNRPLASNTSYPIDIRYTLQFFDERLIGDFMPFKNNTDASFQDHTISNYPSPFLLHYRYGAAVLVKWGKNLEAGTPPARPVPEIAASEAELRAYRYQKRQKQKEQQGAGEGSVEQGKEVGSYDAYDILLWLSPNYAENSAALKAEEEKREAEERDRILEWRRALTS